MSRSEHVSDRLKLHQLKVMLAVGATGTWAKAAKHWRFRNPWCPKAIAELERHAQAFAFSTAAPRGVEPTLYGNTKLLKRGIAIYDELRTSVGAIEFLHSLGGGIAGSEVQFPRHRDRCRQSSASRDNIHASISRWCSRNPCCSTANCRARRIDLMVCLRWRRLQARKDLEPTFLMTTTCAWWWPESPWARRRQGHSLDLIGEPWCLPPGRYWPPGRCSSMLCARADCLCRESSLSSAANHCAIECFADGRFVGV